MQFIPFYLTTIISSFIMNRALELNFYKDIYLNGYKMNLKKDLELDLFKKSTLLDKIINLIPLINMIHCIYKLRVYNDNFIKYLNYLIEEKYIVKMNAQELSEFNLNRSIANAYVMHEKEKYEYESIKKIIIKKSNEEIHYTFDNISICEDELGAFCIKLENLKIIKSSSFLEDKEIVVMVLTRFIKELLENYTIREILKIDIKALLKDGLYFDEECFFTQDRKVDNLTNDKKIVREDMNLMNDEKVKDIKKLVLRKRDDKHKK